MPTFQFIAFKRSATLFNVATNSFSSGNLPVTRSRNVVRKGCLIAAQVASGSA